MAGSFVPTAVGASVEAAVIARIYQEGGRVCTPFDHGMGYDLISDFAGVLNRVEVKKAALTRSRPGSNQNKAGEFSMRWEVDLRARNMVSQMRLPEPDTSDVFVILADASFYVIPTWTIAGRQGMVLRPPGYEPVKRTGRVPDPDPEQFRENWSILKKVQR